MFRSIRFTLLFWYALVLLGSIAVLGTVLHGEMRASLYREADSQLAHWLDLVRRGAQVTTDEIGPQVEQDLRASLPLVATFAVFDADRKLRAASRGFEPGWLPERSGVVTRDDHRWHVAALPDAAGWLVVGRSVRDQNHGIRRFLIALLTTGAGVVILALGGGFLLVSRVLGPAREIARTAQQISARSFDERIPLDRVPTELREVAVTLNDSFARLQESFATQLAFTADASHELRTPLAILRSHLELAGSKPHTPDELRERLAICGDAARRLEAIVASLLTLARADSGELPLDVQSVDLSAMVEAEVDAMVPLAQRRGIELGCDTSPVVVRGDLDRLREVVTNLLDNAIRYSADGGRVAVSVTRDEDIVTLRVADSGIGIAEEHRELIFDRFFRVDAARASSGGGSGLGLAIVRCIVERHGGSVEVGGRVGEGAEFVVRLRV